jgi:Ca-activated chloride channel family protein
MINYFPYEYPSPAKSAPFSLNLDVVTCPWEPTHRLVRIGLKGHQAIVVPANSSIEIEFNPRRVASYRLVGYDRQRNETQDSNEENVGSRSMAAGYALTTFYEVVPLKRMVTASHMQTPSVAENAPEPLLSARLQLNTQGNDDTVGLIQRTVSDMGLDFAAAPSDLKFAAAVAEFGMILRDSEYKGNGTLQQVLEWARQGRGADVNGYRADFIELVRKAQALKRS